ncbi:hypothetical protein MU257_000403 [Salmonella enterica]|nr:hypothetical protein [Salmonella enterica subsp. enterica]EJA7476628.1 hypothetical protein [Salmonella enterica]EJI5129136.1 hypothetical protein [Salmonella enterica]
MFWRNNRPEISLLQHDVAHITFSVRNGKALLRPCVIHDPDSDAGIHTLSWHGSPLIRFYTKAWCPTCAEFVYAGFSNDDEGAAEFLSSLAEWNQTGVGLNEAFTALTPLFSLFADGYYRLEERELYPTDGNGHFFWAVGNEKQPNPATTGQWIADVDYHYQSGEPCFLLPGQPPSRFNPQRAGYYRDKPESHALAWYMNDTWLCVLLDGHHKATAAALEGRPVKTWVISQPVAMSCYETRQQYLRFYDGARLEEAQFQRRIPLKIQYEKLPPSLWEDYFTRHDGRYTRVNWPNALANCATHYPNLAACADIIAAGDLSEAGLNKIMAQGITEEGFPAVLLRALFYTHSPLLIDFVRFLTRAPGYACHYPLAFRLLAQKRTPQADAFFLDFAINDDGERPELTNIMDEYFRQA